LFQQNTISAIRLVKVLQQEISAENYK